MPPVGRGGKHPLIVDSVGRWTRTYDPLDRTRSSQNPYGLTLTFTYDAASQRKALIDPAAGRITYNYDPAGRIKSLKNPLNERTTYAYDEAGRRTEKRLANGTRTSFSYDAADRLTQVDNLTSAGSPIAGFAYAYDPAGNRVGVVESAGDRVTWTYDAANQLSSEHRTGVVGFRHTFAYDPAGNRTLKNEDSDRTTFSYDPANRLHRSAAFSGTTTYTYDAAGNQRTVEEPTGDVVTNTWSYENQNTLVEQPSGDRVTLTYNGDKMQVAREDADETRRFEWDKHNILLETDDLGTPLARNTHEPDEYGRLVSREDLTTSEPAYYHYDALGSTAALSDQSEVVGDEYQYQAWGEQSAPTADPQPYRWVGELGYRYDDDTNRHNLRRRDYDSHLAQFLSQDPPDGDDDPNGYRYAHNQPVQRVDPKGTESPLQPLSPSIFNAIRIMQDQMILESGAAKKGPRPLEGTESIIDKRGARVGRYDRDENVVIGTFGVDGKEVEYRLPYPTVAAAMEKGEYVDWRFFFTGLGSRPLGDTTPKNEFVETAKAFSEGQLVDPEGFARSLRTADRAISKLNLPWLPIGSTISALAHNHAPEVFECEAPKAKECPVTGPEKFIETIGETVPAIQQAASIWDFLQAPPDKMAMQVAEMARAQLPGLAVKQSLELAESGLAKVERELATTSEKTEWLLRERLEQSRFKYRISKTILQFLQEFDPLTCDPNLVAKLTKELENQLKAERQRLEKTIAKAKAEFERLARVENPTPEMREQRIQAGLVGAAAAQQLQVINQAIGWLQQWIAAKNPAILAWLLGIFAVGQTRGGGGGEDKEKERDDNGPRRKVSLGIEDHLDDFSRQHGADSWKVWAKDDPMQWKGKFHEVMNDPNAEVLFNLDGVDEWAGVTRASRNAGGATDWELLQIYKNKEWWSRITWFRDGKAVPNPFE